MALGQPESESSWSFPPKGGEAVYMTTYEIIMIILLSIKLLVDIISEKK